MGPTASLKTTCRWTATYPPATPGWTTACSRTCCWGSPWRTVKVMWIYEALDVTKGDVDLALTSVLPYVHWSP